jgi:hypothetical protein
MSLRTDDVYGLAYLSILSIVIVYTNMFIPTTNTQYPNADPHDSVEADLSRKSIVF